jgi:hypothetical protein
MLYKGNGKILLHGVMVDYIVVKEDEVEGKLNEGYYKTPIEADDPIIEPDANIAPTKEEINAKGKELGLMFLGGTKYTKRLEMINAKIKENEG